MTDDTLYVVVAADPRNRRRHHTDRECSHRPPPEASILLAPSAVGVPECAYCAGESMPGPHGADHCSSCGEALTANGVCPFCASLERNGVVS